MEVETQTIVAARIQRLRSPRHMSNCAAFAKPLAPTANLVRDDITGTILDWIFDGGLVVTAKGLQLDLLLMEETDDPFVRDINGTYVTLMKGVPLTRLDESWGENSRRTINRFFEKIEKPSKQAVDKRLLSMMFWVDLSWKIVEHRKEEIWKLAAE